MRVADYVVDQIYKAGCEHIFLVTGGGAMHLNDAVAAHGKINLLSITMSRLLLWVLWHMLSTTIVWQQSM